MISDLVKAAPILTVGQKMRLHAAGSEHAYKGVLQEIGELYIAAAIEISPEDYINAPLVDTPVEVHLAGRNCLYLTTCAYRGNAPLPAQIWYVKKPDTLERQQQREFVRVPVPLPLRVKTINIYGGYKDARETVSVDISGNGLCFVSEQDIPVPSMVQLLIEDLPGMDELPISADAVRCMPVKVPAGCVYHVGVCFENYLSRPVRTHLLHAINVLQRQVLHKGIR